MKGAFYTMAYYLYPAVFHQNSDGSYTISFPDLPGCITEGKNLENSFRMAESALTVYLETALDTHEVIPAASEITAFPAASGEFLNYVRAEVRNNRAVRRTVSLPQWMDEQVSAAGLSLSRVLQDALRERFC